MAETDDKFYVVFSGRAEGSMIAMSHPTRWHLRLPFAPIRLVDEIAPLLDEAPRHYLMETVAKLAQPDLTEKTNIGFVLSPPDVPSRLADPALIPAMSEIALAAIPAEQRTLFPDDHYPILWQSIADFATMSGLPQICVAPEIHGIRIFGT